ncbi:MAG TPA: helix-hairpin-helix domain-containing protein [Myxococcales bacterium]
MENADIAGMLRQIADILEITDGNPYRVRAYRQAAQVVDTFPEPLAQVSRRGELQSLPSIGERLAATIEEILSTGRCGEQERLASGVPAGVLDLLLVEGIGPKTAAAAWKRLGVTSVDALEASCRDGRLRGLPRMGEQRIKGILEAVARYRQRLGRMPLHRALEYAQTICERLRRVPGVRRVEPAGSVRRRRETVGDLDILVAAESPGPVLRAFGGLPEVASAQAEGPTKSSVRLKIGLQVDLRVVPPESFGAALHYFTGSKAHNIAVRTRAVHRGLKLSEYGIFDREDRRLGGATEEEVFRAVGLPWIPPELREGAGELEAAEEGRLPALLEEKDLRGDLHVHTRDSADARSTLAELAEEARKLACATSPSPTTRVRAPWAWTPRGCASRWPASASCRPRCRTGRGS